MAAFSSSSITSKSLSPTFHPPQQPLYVAFPTSLRPSSLRFSGEINRRKMKGVGIIPQAGATTNQFIFAFAFPLSLLAVTVFTGFQIGNRLDKKFIEELAMDEALREAAEEDNDGTEVVMPRRDEPALPRARNRPKREV